MRVTIISTVATAMLLGGCTMVQSVAVDNKPGASNAGDYVYRLPKTMVRIYAHKVTPGLETIVVKTRLVRDPKQEYIVQYEASVLADDKLTIDRGTGWTMQTINGTADDKTSTVLNNLGKSLGRIEGQNFSRFLSGASQEQTQALLLEFDPVDKESADAAASILKSRNLAFKCIGCGDPSERLNGTFDGVPTRTKSVRHLLICEQTCDAPTAGPTTKRRMFTVNFFNDSPVVALQVGRSLFVKRDTTITFSEGEVAKIEITKPSEAVQAAALPGQVVTSIVEGFTEGLQSQGEVAEAKGTLIDKQMALQGKKIQLMQKELELERARLQTDACRKQPLADQCVPKESTTPPNNSAPPQQPAPPQTPPPPPQTVPPPPAPTPPASTPPATGDEVEETDDTEEQ